MLICPKGRQIGDLTVKALFIHVENNRKRWVWVLKIGTLDRDGTQIRLKKSPFRKTQFFKVQTFKKQKNGIAEGQPWMSQLVPITRPWDEANPTKEWKRENLHNVSDSRKEFRLAFSGLKRVREIWTNQTQWKSLSSELGNAELECTKSHDPDGNFLPLFSSFS